jgi:SpoVK/Ycf46/Vps4 family AAA+-type ATPase
LKTVLSRANRWKAILLIDEADVYVYERGDNLIQNAIVGIFLRVLEYYKGILFMTSNRAVIIDDAILSRVTAHIRYDYPAPDDLKSIWKVQSELLKANLEDSVIDEVVTRFPKISGRDARNILRLAKIIARKRKTKVTLALLEMASKFQDLTAIEETARTEYLESKKK